MENQYGIDTVSLAQFSEVDTGVINSVNFLSVYFVIV